MPGSGLIEVQWKGLLLGYLSANILLCYTQRCQRWKCLLFSETSTFDRKFLDGKCIDVVYSYEFMGSYHSNDLLTVVDAPLL